MVGVLPLVFLPMKKVNRVKESDKLWLLLSRFKLIASAPQHETLVQVSKPCNAACKYVYANSKDVLLIIS